MSDTNDITLREHLSRAGKASAAKLTPEQRSERARKAVQAREAKRAAHRASCFVCGFTGVLHTEATCPERIQL